MKGSKSGNGFGYGRGGSRNGEPVKPKPAGNGTSKADRSEFSKTARKVHPLNGDVMAPRRGGIRL